MIWQDIIFPFIATVTAVTYAIIHLAGRNPLQIISKQLDMAVEP